MALAHALWHGASWTAQGPWGPLRNCPQVGGGADWGVQGHSPPNSRTTPWSRPSYWVEGHSGLVFWKHLHLELPTSQSEAGTRS